MRLLPLCILVVAAGISPGGAEYLCGVGNGKPAVAKLTARVIEDVETMEKHVLDISTEVAYALTEAEYPVCNGGDSGVVSAQKGKVAAGHKALNGIHKSAKVVANDAKDYGEGALGEIDGLSESEVETRLKTLKEKAKEGADATELILLMVLELSKEVDAAVELSLIGLDDRINELDGIVAKIGEKAAEAAAAGKAATAAQLAAPKDKNVAANATTSNEASEKAKDVTLAAETLVKELKVKRKNKICELESEIEKVEHGMGVAMKNVVEHTKKAKAFHQSILDGCYERRTKCRSSKVITYARDASSFDVVFKKACTDYGFKSMSFHRDTGLTRASSLTNGCLYTGTVVSTIVGRPNRYFATTASGCQIYNAMKAGNGKLLGRWLNASIKYTFYPKGGEGCREFAVKLARNTATVRQG